MYAEVAARLGSVDARWLVEEASRLDRSGWSECAGSIARARLEGMVARRQAGEPLQYVLGRWSFRDLDLMVDRRVLIPRPETEIVAEVALAEVRGPGGPIVPDGRAGGRGPTLRRSRVQGPGGPIVVADLGTGSGALALSLAAELPEAEVWATDASPEALAVARANLAAAGPGAEARVYFADGMWYEALPHRLRGGLRVIVSNPPYVAEAEFAGLPREVRDHEPATALVAGPSGRECLEHLLVGGLDWLEPGGALVLELAPHQVPPLRAVAEAAGYGAVAVHPDLTGRDRVLVARRPGGGAGSGSPGGGP